MKTLSDFLVVVTVLAWVLTLLASGLLVTLALSAEPGDVVDYSGIVTLWLFTGVLTAAAWIVSARVEKRQHHAETMRVLRALGKAVTSERS